MAKKNELAEVQAPEIIKEGFDVMARRAKALSQSSMVPKQYQGKPENCLMVMEIADRLNMPVMLVFQQMHEIHGRPAWSAQFLISAWNASGDVTPIRYEQVGEEGTDSYGYRATSNDKTTGELLAGPAVTMAMAKAEGWYSKSGSKWKTMPELMLRYRAAAFLVRTTKPEITMGLMLEDEVRDIKPVEPQPTESGEPAETLFSKMVKPDGIGQ